MYDDVFSEDYQAKITYVCRRTKCPEAEAVELLRIHKGDEIEAVMAIKKNNRRRKQGFRDTYKKEEIKPVSKWDEMKNRTDKLLEDTETYSNKLIENGKDYLKQLMAIPVMKK